uniref:acetylserotonin O-methyltransferase n=1 Tax=Oryza rufipogon TaxID=4529 RepID=A0A0E0QVR2_ORYRU
MAQRVQEEDEQMTSTDDLIQAEIELYHHCFAFIKSTALRAATDLCISDAIHRNGGAATLSDLALNIGLHPTKLSHLRRLMRVLTVSGIFAVEDHNGEAMYTLTRVSRLLLNGDGERTHALSHLVRVLVNPLTVASHFSIHEWFTIEQAAAMTPFEVAHGCTRWEMIANDAKDGSVFNTAMVEDSRVAMDIILKESCGVFQGISSLVDVGGGHGAAAAAIATAFPNIKCTVLDLPHIVAEAPTTHSNIQFVGGDFFEFIPAADVVLLKYILHAWQDDDCVKILRRCKEAILARDAGGKVIIIEVVVGIGSKEIVPKEMQILFDVFMMYVDGIEREEHEWKKIFLEAGFSDYKITPVLGARSIIEVYP